jgi:sugar phosphate isomerase/epimerase
MKLGFVSAILPDRSLEEVAVIAAQEGYECVELMCWPRGRAERRYAGVTHVDVGRFGRDDAARVSDTMAAAGVSISALGYYPNPLSADRAEAAAVIAHLRKVIRAAALLSVGTVNTFVGRDAAKSVDANWPRFRSVWKPLVAFAADQGVRIGIENCPMLFSGDEWPGGRNLAVSPSLWRRMFEDIPARNFGLNYDPSHLVWQQIDCVKPLREFKDRIFHVHAKDVRVDRDRLDEVGILAAPLAYHCPKLPGLGDVPWGKFLSVLGDVGYRGPVCVEVEDRAYEHTLDSRRSALRQSAAFLRGFLPRPTEARARVTHA